MQVLMALLKELYNIIFMDELEYIPIEQIPHHQHIRLEIIVDQDGRLDIRPIDEPTVTAVARRISKAE